MLKTTLLITSRNEYEGMKAILPRIRPEWVDEIVVVDGQSSDGSPEYAETFGWKVVRQKSRGLASAYLEGMRESTGDIIIPFSPDGNSLPEKIPALVAKMREGYDMVIVSRYLAGARSEDDTWLTGFGNWLFTTLINLCFGGHYTDSLVMFRAWRRTIVEQYDFDVSAAGFEPQLSILCARARLKVGEIPGDEPKRLHGERKVNLFLSGLSICRLILKEKFCPLSRKVA